ncbi:aldo/keto reductase [Pseudohongiella spirulinae]|uniref:Aldo/keto reductase n=1 Tax=Pseudohongiella spirulinae TaxID=1249552 RepID=A0A0S2K9W1_9GAMM|nr:aldo/keto reductase [Pseudohongiella spirulinae]ALO45017.1 Aldo/keto reductase [Pseudohongiella spirulinae]
MSLQRPLAKRPLGDSGILVSCLGLGTVKIGRNQSVKYPSHFMLPDDSQVRELLACAKGSGINLLDTAPAYGSSETRLGELMENRHDWIICTKTGEEFDKGLSYFDFSARHTRFSVERSLQRLRTDYLDIVLIHSDGNDLTIIEQTDCFETLARLKSEGKIRAYGLSGKTLAGGLRALEVADVVMVTYNPQEKSERAVITQAHASNKGVLIKKALASGHMPESLDRPDPIHFSLSEPGVSSVVIGTINTTHLEDNVRRATAL